MRTVVIAVIGVLLLAVPAAADQQVNAASGQRYANANVTIAQGEKLTFHNGDSVLHDVTSTQDQDGKPLFSSKLTDPGATSDVDGVQYLTTGTYPFVCSVHPDMQGTLTVSADGTPLPRPGAGGGAASFSAPAMTLRAIKDSGKLKVQFGGAAGNDVIVAASAKIAGHVVKLARGRATLTATPQNVSLKLTSKARSALHGVHKLAVSYKATVLAASGSQSLSTKRTYR